MINDSIRKGTYVETVGNILKKLLWFYDFLHRKLYNNKHCKDIKPESNQPGLINLSLMELFINWNLTTHKFNNLEDITVVNLEFWLITDQTLTVTSNYLRPWCQNEYSSMIHKNIQACYHLEFHLYKMTKKMYHMMVIHCLQIF